MDRRTSRGIRRFKKEAGIRTCISLAPWSETFILQTDAIQEGLEAVLSKQDGGSERIIAYACCSLSSAEKNYSATELECLTDKWGIWKMRDYVEGYHFTVITNHLPLK